jgi:hypothetical protein
VSLYELHTFLKKMYLIPSIIIKTATPAAIIAATVPVMGNEAAPTATVVRTLAPKNMYLDGEGRKGGERGGRGGEERRRERRRGGEEA